MSMPPSGPAPSRNNPGLVVALVISIVIAIGAAAYGFLQSQKTSQVDNGGTIATNSSTNDQRRAGVEIFNHVAIETSRTSTDTNEGGYTYLQAHDDELSYCTKFDEETDGATTADLLNDSVYQKISSRVGSDNVVDVNIALDDTMSIDNGLLTDLCNDDGEIYALILASDLQTMTPYHLGTDRDGNPSLKAYSPILTPGGYGALYFDHVPGTVVFSTGHYPETDVLAWEYYALDPAEGASDLIESCTRDASSDTSVELSCEREYTP